MRYKVTLNNKVYEVEVDETSAMLVDEYEALAPVAPAPVAAPVAAAPAAAPAPAAPAPAAAAAGEQVTAPMPGTILKVTVTQGAAVKKGDILVVLEAMKMENEIMAPKDGTVAQIAGAKGATVDTGALLAVIA